MMTSLPAVSRICAHRLAVVGAFLGLVLSGCSFDKPTPTERSSTADATDATLTAWEPRGSQFLTQADVQGHSPGSPARAVFNFWFQIQHRDLLSAYESLAREFRTRFAGSLRRFGRYVMADYSRWLTKPRLLFVQTEGDKATVALTYRNSARIVQRSSFSLRQSASGWAIAYEAYLANRLSANDLVTSESIFDGGSGQSPELPNSSFEEGTLTPWRVAGEQYATFVATPELPWEGLGSAKIHALGKRVRGSVMLTQIVRQVEAVAPGSRYRFVIRARARGLNRPVQVELKLIYGIDKFDFFLGRAVAGPSGLPSGTGIPPGTWRHWITLEVDAVAKRRVRAIQVFAFDSGPGPLRGTVWLDGAELSSPEPKRG
jgi:hypothetical protein